MGNNQSQFQEKFHQMYAFVQIVNDPHFHSIKVYRKRFQRYDYIMIIQKSIHEIYPNLLSDESKRDLASVQKKISLIRTFQNDLTAKLQYFRVLKQNNLSCSDLRIRMYVEYYNHTLFDYLSALRRSQIFIGLDEICFIIRSLAEAMLTLRKMEINDYEINIHNIFVDVDQGKIFLNPAYFICQSFQISTDIQVISKLSQDYCKLSLANTFYIQPKKYLKITKNQGNQLGMLQRRQLQNIRKVFLELARYLIHPTLSKSKGIYDALAKCKHIKQIINNLQQNCQCLNVEQFLQTVNSAGKLYA